MPGSYVAEISRGEPGCVLFLLDQSGSMNDTFAGDLTTRKSNAAANAVNNLLRNIVLRCTANIGEGPRNYFYLGAVGYGSRRGVGPCFGGALDGRGLVPVAELADNLIRVEERTRWVPDGSGRMVDTVVKFPIWLDPIAEGESPMSEALQFARNLLEPWVAAHKTSYPPIVINITDGEPNNNPVPAARRLAELYTTDGTVLLYNLHLSSLATPPILFPSSPEELPDRFAQMLFEMSAIVPRRIAQELELEGYVITPAAKGFVFNADVTALIQFLDIGTRLGLTGN